MRRRALFAAALIALATVGWSLRWQSSESRYMGDSYQYAKRAYQIAGASSVEAENRAMDATCRWLRHRSDADRFPHGCVPGLHSSRPPYDAIFRDRLGFPAAVALWLPALGRDAFAFVSWLSAAGAALAIGWVMRAAGRSRTTCAVAVALLFAMPESTWLARVGSESPALLGLTACVAAATVASHGRRWRLTTWRFGATALCLFLVRPPTGVAMTAALAVAFGVRWCRRRHVGDLRLAVVATVGLAVQMLGMRLLHSPGLTATLQDTFTHHFHTRPVGDLPVRYAHLVVATSRTLVANALAHPFPPLVTLLGVAAAVRHRQLRLFAVSIASVAVASAAVHPVATEVPRLLSPLAAVAAAGWAVVIVRVARHVPRFVRVGWRRRTPPPSIVLPCPPVPPAPENAAVPSIAPRRSR